MCKYCDKFEEMEDVDLLVDNPNLMACITKISPITKRRYPEFTGELQVYTNDSNTISVPIKYCPICGKEL